jgi:hypothetical protein
VRLNYVQLHDGPQQRWHLGQVKLEKLADRETGWFRAVHFDELRRAFARQIDEPRGKNSAEAPRGPLEVKLLDGAACIRDYLVRRQDIAGQNEQARLARAGFWRGNHADMLAEFRQYSVRQQRAAMALAGGPTQRNVDDAVADTIQQWPSQAAPCSEKTRLASTVRWLPCIPSIARSNLRDVLQLCGVQIQDRAPNPEPAAGASNDEARFQKALLSFRQSDRLRAWAERLIAEYLDHAPNRR